MMTVEIHNNNLEIKDISDIEYHLKKLKKIRPFRSENIYS